MGYKASEAAQAEARKWLGDMEIAIDSAGVDWITVPLLLAIVDRETLWGQSRAYKDVFGTPDDKSDDLGDSDHGHGFFQVDNRSHEVFLESAKWKIFRESADYVIEHVLKSSYRYLAPKFPRRGPEKIQWDAVAAYNCGAGNVRKSLNKGRGRDARTTGRDYAKDVKRRMDEFWAPWYEKIKGDAIPVGGEEDEI
jgi:hypothetical protein